MDDVGRDWFLSTLQVFIENALDGVLTSLKRGVAEDAGRLVNDDEEGILVNDADKFAVERVQVAAAGNLDELSGKQRGVVLRGDDLIDIDHLLRQQLLGTGAVAAGHDGQQEVHQRLLLAHVVVGVVVGQFAVVEVLRSLVVISAHCFMMF